MDLEEKVTLFNEIVMESQEKKIRDQLHTFEASLNDILEDHKREERSKAAIEVETERENVRKESNKEVAQLQLQLQRDLGKQQQQLKEDVFRQVRERLEDYMKTPDYVHLLELQMRHAISVAGGEDLVLYVDPVDADKVEALQKRIGHDISVSSRPFIGGSRGVVQSRKLLIDQSFLTRLEEERANFSFDRSKEEIQ